MKKIMPASIAAAAGLALVLSACSSGDPMSQGSEQGSDGSKSEQIIVGSADFAESQLVATIYAQSLREAGVEVEEKLNIGSREVYIEALKDGSIDLLPEYNGYLLAELVPDTAETDREVIREKLAEALPEGTIALGESEAENKDVLVVNKSLAQQHGLETMSDLKPVAGELTLAGPAEWKSRYIGVPGLEDLYGLTFKKFQVFDAGGPLTLAALEGGQAEVGMMFSSDPVITEKDFVSLTDDQGLFLPANILPVIRESKASPEVRKVLNQVSDALTMEALLEMNGQVSQGDDIAKIAEGWRAQNGL